MDAGGANGRIRVRAAGTWSLARYLTGEDLGEDVSRSAYGTAQGGAYLAGSSAGLAEVRGVERIAREAVDTLR